MQHWALPSAYGHVGCVSCLCFLTLTSSLYQTAYAAASSKTKKLRGMGERLGIIFVTGNPEFALEGYDLEAVSYIVKPIKRERLHMALNRASYLIHPSQVDQKRPVRLEESFRPLLNLLLHLPETSSAGQASPIPFPDQSFMPAALQAADIREVHLLHLSRRQRKKEIRMENRMLVPVARGKWEPLNQAYMAYFRREARREAD